MENIIKDNRLVKDKTFAKRLLSFAESTEVGCAAGEDERDSMISYAKSLLKYQVRTATDESEIDYLKRVGVWEKYQEPFLETEDGHKIFFESEDCEIFSCVKEPPIGDQILYLTSQKIREGRTSVKANRVYFKDKDECSYYIEANKPRYSIRDVEEMLRSK